MFPDVPPLPRDAEPTHYMRVWWRVGNYLFLEAALKPAPNIEPGIYFVAYRGEWVSRSSFPTLHHAMYEASQFGMSAERLATV